MTDERRVVEFGDVRYEYLDGHWWPDVTAQERVLVEELERQQAGMRQLLAERDQAERLLDLALYLHRRVTGYRTLPSHLLDDIENLLNLAEVDR